MRDGARRRSRISGAALVRCGFWRTIGDAVPDDSPLPEGLDDLRGQVFEDRYPIDEICVVGPSYVFFTGTADDDREILLELFRPASVTDRSSAERLARCVKTTRRIRHPNVVCPVDFGERYNGTLYLVSERPPGVPLLEFIASLPDKRLPWPTARPLLVDLCRGLGTIHRRRLVHGALWPDMCWVEVAEHADPRLRLLGLGSNVNPTASDQQQSGSGTAPFAGDPRYVAPDTVRGEPDSALSDAYLAGLIAYTMLVGEPPYCEGSPFQILAAHLKDPVPSIDEHVAELPEGLGDLITALLAKDPAARPQSMAEVEKALLSFAVPGPALLEVADGARPLGYEEAREEPAASAYAPQYSPPPYSPPAYSPPAYSPPEAQPEPSPAAPVVEAEPPTAPIHDGQTETHVAIDDALVERLSAAAAAAGHEGKTEATVSLSLPGNTAKPPARQATDIYDASQLEAVSSPSSGASPGHAETPATELIHAADLGIERAPLAKPVVAAPITAPPATTPSGAFAPVSGSPPVAPVATPSGAFAPVGGPHHANPQAPASPPPRSSSFAVWLVVTAVVAAIAGIAIGVVIGGQ